MREEISSQIVWRIGGKDVSLHPKSGENKYIDNIRPPKAA